MNEKNERNLDSTVDEIMEEIREQNVSAVSYTHLTLPTICSV